MWYFILKTGEPRPGRLLLIATIAEIIIRDNLLWEINDLNDNEYLNIDYSVCWIRIQDWMDERGNFF